ncbi:cupin domain-containing protein [Phyllobacterium salinisoli]|uniref:Cupin domain-containing protein n=2 Tax=Phyllobacterium salinisoli TaxID=1899321 RepID=A0A368K951_9HYPH|nr:cupin domain-containing protein [Phyllobacterium salinisoli]
MSDAGRLAAAFEAIDKYWSPRVIAMANGQYVKIAKVMGDFVWHCHAGEDEFFLVHRGTFVLRYRDGSSTVLKTGDFHVIPRGVEHFPSAPEETWIIFVEPAGTKHAGDSETQRAKSIEEQTTHLRHALSEPDR